MANRHRGEVDLTLKIDGKPLTVPMVPDMAFIAAVEDRFGGIMALGRRFAAQEWKITEIVGILQIAIKPHGVKPEEVEAAVLAEPAAFYAPVFQLLANALNGGREGNVGAATS